MVKTYLLNQNYNNATFTISGEGGNLAQFAFRGGNMITNTPAWLTLENPYFQDLLESSEMFKQGRVVFDKETAKEIAINKELAAKEKVFVKEEETIVEDSNKSEFTIVANVKTVAQAQNYVAEHFGESAKTAAQAKAIANANGVDFPNLRLGKK